MNELDFLFQTCLRNQEYISMHKQWLQILVKLQNNKADKQAQTTAKTYFEKTYYPKILAPFHTPKALYEHFWKGNLESYNVGADDMKMKLELAKNGFDGNTEMQVMAYRKSLSREAYKNYKQMISLQLAKLSQDEKLLASIIYGEVQRVNDTAPTKGMLMVASLIKNRVDYVNKQIRGSAEYKQAVSDYGNGTYLGTVSHYNQFGSYKGTYYNMMINNIFPDDYKSLKTALGCIAAAGKVYKEVPQEYQRLMFMRTGTDTKAPGSGLEDSYISEGGNNFWKLKKW